jgi:hypothetical protein
VPRYDRELSSCRYELDNMITTSSRYCSLSERLCLEGEEAVLPHRLHRVRAQVVDNLLEVGLGPEVADLGSPVPEQVVGEIRCGLQTG